MDMILDICQFQNRFPVVVNICCGYTLELPHRANSNMYPHDMSFNKGFYHLHFFYKNFSTIFIDSV